MTVHSWGRASVRDAAKPRNFENGWRQWLARSEMSRLSICGRPANHIFSIYWISRDGWQTKKVDQGYRSSFGGLDHCSSLSLLLQQQSGMKSTGHAWRSTTGKNVHRSKLCSTRFNVQSRIRPKYVPGVRLSLLRTPTPDSRRPNSTPLMLTVRCSRTVKGESQTITSQKHVNRCTVCY